MKFAAVGFTCIDVYNNLDKQYATGNGVDLLFNLQELLPNIKGSVVTAVGDDTYGQLMIDTCKSRGVDTRYIRRVFGGKTAVIEMQLNGKDRVHHKVERGVMQDYDLTDEDLDFIIQQDCIHTDLSWKVTKFLPMIRKNNTKIYFDFSKRFSHPDVNEICRHINWGIFSFNQDTPQVRDLLMKGCQLGAEVLIATFGERGALACDGKDYYFQPALPTPYLVNTVGAGDSFGAGFLSGMLSGKSIDKSMQLGAEKACEIVSIFEPYNIRE